MPVTMTSATDLIDDERALLSDPLVLDTRPIAAHINQSQRLAASMQQTMTETNSRLDQVCDELRQHRGRTTRLATEVSALRTDVTAMMVAVQALSNALLAMASEQRFPQTAAIATGVVAVGTVGRSQEPTNEAATQQRRPRVPPPNTGPRVAAADDASTAALQHATAALSERILAAQTAARQRIANMAQAVSTIPTQVESVKMPTVFTTWHGGRYYSQLSTPSNEESLSTIRFSVSYLNLFVSRQVRALPDGVVPGDENTHVWLREVDTLGKEAWERVRRWWTRQHTGGATLKACVATFKKFMETIGPSEWPDGPTGTSAYGIMTRQQLVEHWKSTHRNKRQRTAEPET